MQNIYPILTHNRELIIKIANFSLPQHPLRNGYTHIIDTFEYLAPEKISDEQPTDAVDIWSVGCLSYRLWVGEDLFSSQGDVIRYELTNSRKDFDGRINQTAANLLLREMIRKEPQFRPSARDALSHEWFKELSDVETPKVTDFFYDHFAKNVPVGKES